MSSVLGAPQTLQTNVFISLERFCRLPAIHGNTVHEDDNWVVIALSSKVVESIRKQEDVPSPATTGHTTSTRGETVMSLFDNRGRFSGQKRRSPDCGKDVYIAKGSVFTCKTTIGTGTRINGPMVAKGPGTLLIGNYCAIGRDVRIITTNHSLGHLNLQHILQNKITGRTEFESRRDARIGNSCWIGDCVIILPGAEIGDGCIIGAGAVVTKSYTAFSVLTGNPARLIRMRFDDEIIAALQNLAWWNWDLETMRKHSELFDTNPDEFSSGEFLELIAKSQA